MNNNNGGPAFPAGVVRKSRPIHDPGAGFVVTDITEPRHNGMSLRDYFAAKSLPLGWKVFDEGYSPDECSPENIAKFAYLMADAMLAEREKGGSTMNEYLFDVKLFATIRIKAESEAEARATILDHLDYACVNAGAWPNGDPILFEASAMGDFNLIEINGEPTCHALPNSAFVVW